MVQLSQPDFALQHFQAPSKDGGLSKVVGDAFKSRSIRQDTNALVTGQDAEGEQLSPLQMDKSYARLLNLGGPKVTAAVTAIIGSRDKKAKADLALKIAKTRKNSLRVAQAKTPAEAKRIIAQIIQEQTAAREDISGSMRLMNATPEERQAILKSDIEKSESVEDLQQRYDVDKIIDNPDIDDTEKASRLELIQKGSGKVFLDGQKAKQEQEVKDEEVRSSKAIALATTMRDTDNRPAFFQQMLNDPRTTREQKIAISQLQNMSEPEQTRFLEDRITREQTRKDLAATQTAENLEGSKSKLEGEKQTGRIDLANLESKNSLANAMAIAKEKARLAQLAPGAKLDMALKRLQIAEKRQEKFDKERKTKLADSGRKIKFAIQDGKIREAKALARKMMTTGFIGNVMRFVGDSDALDLQTNLDVIKANLGFDALEAMRAASPTGGALGQITERELSFLQSTIASLNQAQSQESLLKSLDQIQLSMVRWRTEMNKATDAELAATGDLNQTPFTDPNKADPEANEFTDMSDEDLIGAG